MFDRRTQDVGNIVEFGHLNLTVTDQSDALDFYVGVLGLTRDPYRQLGRRNAWINVGRQQFHLPVAPRAQRVRGCIGLVVPDPQAVFARLAGDAVAAHDAEAGLLRCPWGNRLRLHAPQPARFGPMRLGIGYVELQCPAGSAAGIGRFYRELLGACTHAAGPGAVDVQAGPWTRLAFRESASSLPDWDGHHVQITVADFSGPHRRLHERGLVTQESNDAQYRFDTIVDPDDGAPLMRLEHEVRSLRHPQAGRVLVNRPEPPNWA